jgi:hypothetical protein
MDHDMKFYEFSQNNTGGYFDVDAQVCHRLFIEADSARAAKQKALDLGVYFDGIDKGMDCPCCGDRWYGCEEVEFPHYSGAETVEDVAQFLADTYGWTTPDARIFYKDGSVKEVFSE